MVALSGLVSGWFSRQPAKTETPSDPIRRPHWLLTGYGLLWWYVGGLLETVIITQLYDPQYLLAGMLSFRGPLRLVGELIRGRLTWRGIAYRGWLSGCPSV